MLNEEVLLEAIRANLLDDAPWLIYSDWLLEQDREDYIRLYPE